MEFLDPKAKKRHRIRLMIGYALMGTMITIITLILVFQAYGFDVNRKTGEVIQNGLVFIDSAPDKATVSFNNQEQKNKSNNRFSLPSGDYTLKITKDGYRDWTRTMSLGGGEVKRFTYPLLIPKILKPTELQAYDTVPTISTESPDRRWMIVSQANSLTAFTEYDLNSVNKNKNDPDSRQFAIPATVLTAATASQSFEVVEWSTDNKHLLVKHIYDDKSEFIVISRDQPETSFNINVLLAVNPDKVTLKDKKFDQWYIYTQAGGVLQSADIKKVITPLFTNVTAYKSHSDDTILYSQTVGDGTAQRISLLQGKDSYAIKEVAGTGVVMLDIARYDGSWYLMVGVDSDQKTYIYKDPQSILNKKDGTKLSPRTVLRHTGPLIAVSFSNNTRFMAAQSGQHFEVYDAEDGQIYRYTVEEAFDPAVAVTWMDGHRLHAQSGGKAFIFDFDGSNKQQLVSSIAGRPILFDRDYTVVYSLSQSTSSADKTSLFTTNLRQPEDR